MPRKPPPPGPGRPKGSPNKRSATIRERIYNSADPVEYLCDTVNNKVKCSVCGGRGRTKFQPRGDAQFEGERTCQSCWGSGLERIPPKDRAWAAAELLNYCEKKLKAVEIMGEDGGAVKHEHVLRFID